MTIREALDQAGLSHVRVGERLAGETVIELKMVSDPGWWWCGDRPALGWFVTPRVHGEFRPTLVGDRDTMEPQEVVLGT